MTRTNAKTLTTIALLTALTLVLGKTFQFSMAVGFFTLLDIGIYFAAFYLGKKEGAAVGALSGFLIDLISGYPQYMLVSLLAHGFQGYFAGFRGKKQIPALVVASIIMIGTYFVAEYFFYGLAPALKTLAGNSLQNLVGMIGGYLLYRVLKGVTAK